MKIFCLREKKTIWLPQEFEIPTGEIKVYKKVRTHGLGVVVHLTIPAEARRVHAPGQRKCRAEYAIVNAIKEIGTDKDRTEVTNKAYTPHVTYKVGERVNPDFFDDSLEECSHGINFFLNETEAIKY
jgi:hypothetical protein